MKLHYNCVFCKKPGTVEYDPSNPLTEAQVAAWLKCVACDPCATYTRSSRDLTHYIYQAANNWSALLNSTSAMPPDARESARTRFQRLLMKLCAAREKFKSIAGIYQSQFSDDLIDEPQQASRVINRILAA
jgi:hypothetical protein